MPTRVRLGVAALLLLVALAGCTPAAPAIRIEEQGPGVGGKLYRVTVTAQDSDELQLLVTTSDGPPVVTLRDVTGDGRAEVLVTFAEGPSSSGLVVYQYRQGQWAQVLNLNGHPRLVSVPGGQAEVALSTTCCPYLGWGYTWNEAAGYVPIPPEQILAVFRAAKQPVDGLQPAPEMARPQPIQPVQSEPAPKR